MSEGNPQGVSCVCVAASAILQVFGDTCYCVFMSWLQL